MTDKYNDLQKMFKQASLINIPKRHTNFFEIAGFPHYENVASNVLKFFLDPTQEHNMQLLFLKSLLECYKDISGEDYTDPYFGKEITIHREYQTKNNKRIDLVIETPSFIIGIENKIYHHENNDFNDYYKTLECLSNDKTKKIIAIILKPNFKNVGNNKYPKDKFYPLTYKDLFKKIFSKLSEMQYTSAFNINMEYFTFLKHFAHNITNIEQGHKMTIDKQLLTFLDENKNNIEHFKELEKNYNDTCITKLNDIIQLLSIEDRVKNEPTSEIGLVSNYIRDHFVLECKNGLKIKAYFWIGTESYSKDLTIELYFREKLLFIPGAISNASIKIDSIKEDLKLALAIEDISFETNKEDSYDFVKFNSHLNILSDSNDIVNFRNETKTLLQNAFQNIDLENKKLISNIDFLKFENTLIKLRNDISDECMLKLHKSNTYFFEIMLHKNEQKYFKLVLDIVTNTDDNNNVVFQIFTRNNPQESFSIINNIFKNNFTDFQITSSEYRVQIDTNYEFFYNNYARILEIIKCVKSKLEE